MEAKTFRELYEAEKRKETPAQVFLLAMSTLTHKSIPTIKAWLSGRQVPDELTKNRLAEKFKCKAEDLFPEV